MGLLVVKADFIGKYELVKSPNDKIDGYIQQHEEKILRELFGSELFELFKADVNPTTMKPTDPIYLALFDPLEIDGWYCGKNQSQGLKEMLLGFIYFQYVRDSRIKQGANGPVKNESETSTNAFPLDYLFRYQNEAVDSFNVIRSYCIDRPLDYPTLKGCNKKYSSWV